MVQAVLARVVTRAAVVEQGDRGHYSAPSDDDQDENEDENAVNSLVSSPVGAAADMSRPFEFSTQSDDPIRSRASSRIDPELAAEESNEPAELSGVDEPPAVVFQSSSESLDGATPVTFKNSAVLLDEPLFHVATSPVEASPVSRATPSPPRIRIEPSEDELRALARAKLDAMVERLRNL